MSQTDPTQYQCRHIKPDGARCGSPALRNEQFCYYHHSTRRCGPRQPGVTTLSARKSSTFDLPSPADLAEHTGIGLALGLILHKIAHNEIDPRRAGLLLHGLQIASINLKRHRTPQPAILLSVEEVAFDPDFGPLAPEAELGSNEPKGQVQLLVERLDREEQVRKDLEQADWDARRQAFEAEKQQREAWKREDELRPDKPESNPQSAHPQSTIESPCPEITLASPLTPSRHSRTESAFLLPHLQARAEINAGSCRASHPAPRLNRRERRRLHQLLNRGTQSTPPTPRTPPEVQT